jgi:hypothetical protein
MGFMTRGSIDDFKERMIFTDSKTTILNDQLFLDPIASFDASIEYCPVFPR